MQSLCSIHTGDSQPLPQPILLPDWLSSLYYKKLSQKMEDGIRRLALYLAPASLGNMVGQTIFFFEKQRKQSHKSHNYIFFQFHFIKIMIIREVGFFWRPGRLWESCGKVVGKHRSFPTASGSGCRICFSYIFNFPKKFSHKI